MEKTKNRLTRRERVRQATIDEIKQVAKEQIAEKGALSLSMGGIARTMGMTTPALYRYFESRDQLIEALVVDAFNDLANSLEEATEKIDESKFTTRFKTVLECYRNWGLQNSQLYALMFGASTKRDIDMAQQGQRLEVVLAITRTLVLFITMLMDAHRAGKITIPETYLTPPDALELPLSAMQFMLANADVDQDALTAVLTLAFMVWIQFHGLIWHELHGPLLSEFLSSGDLYRMEIQSKIQFLKMKD